MINNTSNIHPYKVSILDKATCYNFLLDNKQPAAWSWTKRRMQDQVQKFISGREHEISFYEFNYFS